MRTPEARIALVLKISQDEAVVFLSRVRFASRWPPHDAWIARCVEMFPELTTPVEVANKLAEMGWVSHEFIGPAAMRGKQPKPKAPRQPPEPQEQGAQPNPPTWVFSERRGETPPAGRPKGPEQAASPPKAPGRAGKKHKKPKRRVPAAPPETGLVEVSPANQQRVWPGRIGRCRHGVPLTDVCRICSPEKFEQRGDVD